MFRVGEKNLNCLAERWGAGRQWMVEGRGAREARWGHLARGSAGVRGAACAETPRVTSATVSHLVSVNRTLDNFISGDGLGEASLGHDTIMYNIHNVMWV